MQVIGAAGTRGPPAVSPVEADSVPGQGYARDVVRAAVCAQLENSSNLMSVIGSLVMVMHAVAKSPHNVANSIRIKDSYLFTAVPIWRFRWPV